MVIIDLWSYSSHLELPNFPKNPQHPQAQRHYQLTSMINRDYKFNDKLGLAKFGTGAAVAARRCILRVCVAC